MKLTITGYPQGMKIQAIKALRTVTGMGLKETKEAIDSIDVGAAPSVSLLPSLRLREAMHTLDCQGLTYRGPNRLVFLRERLLGLWERRPRVRVLSLGVPVYVTRPTSDGMIAAWSVNALVGLFALILLQINAIVWPLIGLYEAARIIFG